VAVVLAEGAEREQGILSGAAQSTAACACRAQFQGKNRSPSLPWAVLTRGHRLVHPKLFLRHKLGKEAQEQVLVLLMLSRRLS
jgi:hypothetical protein